MTLILRCPDETAVPPRPVHLVLSCDAAPCAIVQTFTEDGYIANRSAATRAGWLINDMGKVFCPTCKGKR